MLWHKWFQDIHVHTNCRNLQKLHIINLSTFNICIMFDRESNKTERISYDIYEYKRKRKNLYFQYFWTIDLFRIGNELYEKYSSSQANTHKHGIRFALKILNLYAASTHIFFVLNLDFSKLGWNSKSLLIYTDLTKHAQLKITHKKTTFSHLRSTNAVLSLSMQSLTWYRSLYT